MEERINFIKIQSKDTPFHWCCFNHFRVQNGTFLLPFWWNFHHWLYWEVVTMTTSSAASEEIFVKMITFPFQWMRWTYWLFVSPYGIVNLGQCWLWSWLVPNHNLNQYEVLSIRTYFGKILFAFQTFSSKKMHLKMLSAKKQPFCSSLHEIKWSWVTCQIRQMTSQAGTHVPHSTWSLSNPRSLENSHLVLFYWVDEAAKSHYDMVSFLQNSHNRHPIARPHGRAMGCLLWVQSKNQVLPLYWKKCHVITDNAKSFVISSCNGN